MIAVDRGRSATKILSHSFRAAWPPLVARLHASPPAAILENTGAERGAVIRVDGTWWAVGEPAVVYAGASLRLDERKATQDARAVVGAALWAAGYRAGRVDVGLAVPAALARGDAERLARLAAGRMEVNSGDGHADVWVRAVVLPEPAAAAMAILLGEDGAPDPEAMRRSICVVDLGHRTLDVAALRAGRLVEGSVRSTPTGGVLAFENWIREDVEPEVGLLTDSERAAVVEAAAEGKIPVVRGQPLPRALVGRLQDHLFRLGERVISDVRNSLAATQYDVLLFTGGMAEVLRDYLLREWPQASIPAEPRWSVAEGLLRFLRYTAARRGER